MEENYKEVNLTDDEFIEICARVAADLIANLKILGAVDDETEDIIARLLAVYSAKLSETLANSVEEIVNATNYA